MKNGISVWDWACGVRAQSFGIEQIIRLEDRGIISPIEARTFLRNYVPETNTFLFAKTKEGREDWKEY